MKRNSYSLPAVEVIEVEIEDAVLGQSGPVDNGLIEPLFDNGSFGSGSFGSGSFGSSLK